MIEETEYPHRRLFCEIVDRAVQDSREQRNYELREKAQVWLQTKHCEHYCTLVGINYQAMIERLRAEWDGQTHTLH